MAYQHLEIRVTGRVQGVFFRASAQQEAHRLGIMGFTRNEDDGSVYIQAEGEAGPLREFIRWCHAGPDFAHVDQVHVSQGKLQGFKSFTIDY